MNTELRWFLINLLLPLSPFALRVFLDLMGPQGNISISNIAQLPELLFYSVFVSVLILNINLDSKKTTFEALIRLFIYILLVLDFLTLGLIYSGKLGPHVWKFTFISAIMPALIAPFYRKIFSME